MEKIDQIGPTNFRDHLSKCPNSFRDVAEQCGVSRAAIHQRVQRMIENNVITDQD
jgi:Lrp/AsnC family transcriptional regulator for asnA, asnC and gidA